MKSYHIRFGYRHALILLAFLAALGGNGFGQEVNASVYGIVQDLSGSVVPGVEVQLRSLDTNRMYRALTDDSGNYNITQVPIGRYEVSAELQGFKKSVVTDILLRVNDRRRVNFNLEVGGISETVTVAATLVAVDTASGTTSNVMGSEDLLQLPSSGRQLMPLAMIMPGVTGRNTDTRTSQQQAVNGVRPTHNAWLLDGGYNIDTGGNWGMPMAPNMETVAEFRALRGNYSAEFGIGGGSQFNVVTRAGTNEFHGAASWYHRADWINARGFFSPTKDAFRNNDFGG
ncbi:MAG TPA: carboxypeptidase-like regulatory domain-containing protein, partial [Gemmataceae bacterium]|nr:carboxypeptidase-like regulatory domain-containing protein [Gemmataceae bacterium]